MAGDPWPLVATSTVTTMTPSRRSSCRRYSASSPLVS
ncbi:Uncharacterised protein [Bordetella pertussis]|nr:Uncharacterised protein [Bordetella pertussis]